MEAGLYLSLLLGLLMLKNWAREEVENTGELKLSDLPYRLRSQIRVGRRGLWVRSLRAGLNEDKPVYYLSGCLPRHGELELLLLDSGEVLELPARLKKEIAAQPSYRFNLFWPRPADELGRAV